MNKPRVTCIIEAWGIRGAYKATIWVNGVPVRESYFATHKDAEAWCDKEIAWREQEARVEEEQ